jgi:PIN domain nuclease of toxin-antitoxin system
VPALMNRLLDTHAFLWGIGKLGINRVLPVQPKHVNALVYLPAYHKDPFDRILIAQCRAERLSLVSADPGMTAYDVEVLW